MTGLLAAPSTRSRRAVTISLVFLTGLSWAYLGFLSTRMNDVRSPFAMPMTSAWTGQDVGLMWIMWSVMMAGMMVPSAVPMFSVYAATVRSGVAGLYGSAGLFVIGYLATWSGFAIGATGAQWALVDAGLISSMGAATSRSFGGALLLAAGVYQFSSAKRACLRQCRGPLNFLLNHWRNGRRGAFVMGVRHGALCVGCCWVLMAGLFVLGVMNLWWIAALAAAVLLEKLVAGDAIPRILGSSLAIWGLALTAGLVS